VSRELKRTPQPEAVLAPILIGDLYNDEIGFALGEVIEQLHHLTGL
jgi:hypothetical protein